MRAYLQKLTVAFDYPVYFTTEVFAPDNPDLLEAITRREPGRRHRVFAVVEAAVGAVRPGLLAEIAAYVARHRDRLALAAEPLVVPGGEPCKNDPAAPGRLQGAFQAARLDRQAAILIVGGGALLDMAGYAAATVHRGLRVVRLPTTVLAQNDAGVGVKNGINAFGAKNFLGAFAPPFAVLNDARFLDTLSRRDTIAGTAEAVKVALIRDAAFYDWLVAHAAALAAGAREPLGQLIRRCAELHLEHIATSGDAFELGSARPLDFGHWAAHKLEVLSGYRLRHGEAVAIGIALDTIYSAEAGLLAKACAEPVLDLLERLGLPLWDGVLDVARPGDGRPAILDGLAEFQEHLGGELAVTLLRAVGRGVEVGEVREELVRAALDRLRRRGAPR